MPAKTLDPQAMDLLENYDWPGNVRQLVNITRRMMVTAPGNVISSGDVPDDLGAGGAGGSQKDWTKSLADWAEQAIGDDEAEPLMAKALPEFTGRKRHVCSAGDGIP